MTNINLSKSSYCSCVQCKKILWLNKYKSKVASPESNETALENGKRVGELAKGLFGDYDDVPYDNDISRRIENTDKFLQNKGNVITEASFIYNNNFCSVDILKNDSDGVEIYEVKSSTEIKDIYLDDVAYQYFILSNLGFNVKKTSIVYINKEYVREKNLDMNQLFNIEDVTDTVCDKQNEVVANIRAINEYMIIHGKDSEPDTDIGPHCFDPYTCPYWDYCTENLLKPNVFDISGMWKSKKFEKYYEGIISFDDLIDEKLNPKYLEQIDFELNDREPKINLNSINELLDTLHYPLYFIDYESCQFAVPELEGTKPYQQIPFQYSLHIIPEKGAEMIHKEFLADVDDDNMIRTFAESMIRDMPENGSVIVYNKAFEATRNREIGEMFDDLKSEMERFNTNMVDLMVPFRNRDYYTKEMKGSYSIKYVLPALYPEDKDLNYTNLPVVHNGSEASEAFMSLKEKSPGEQKRIRYGLLRYCELDTLAMVKIWENFKEVLE